MKRAVFLILTLTLFSAPVFADWDPELEAQEQAKREAAERAAQERQREIQRKQKEMQDKVNAAQMQSKRQVLGAAAQGKSDAEVNRLYDAKIKADTEAALQSAQSTRGALSHGQGAEALKQITGKSLEELENMSDEEAEAFGRAMEEKYGQ